MSTSNADPNKNNENFLPNIGFKILNKIIRLIYFFKFR